MIEIDLENRSTHLQVETLGLAQDNIVLKIIQLKKKTNQSKHLKNKKNYCGYGFTRINKIN